LLVVKTSTSGRNLSGPVGIRQPAQSCAPTPTFPAARGPDTSRPWDQTSPASCGVARSPPASGRRALSRGALADVHRPRIVPGPARAPHSLDEDRP
jgi:hypothetical protein